jgi:putative heme-binding domain-containing protein
MSFGQDYLRGKVAALTVCVWLVAAATVLAQPPKSFLVAETDPLSPAEQQKMFHLPPGFEIQLVASEPAIGQPMNLNFDAAGRLWVTHSIEYPYPARGDVEPRDPRFPDVGDHEPRDRLTVFAGIGPNGTPAKTWNFIDGLNIPMGHTSVKGGVIVYSIPNIYFCPDADGDGKSDARRVLYGKFGNIDTHGMNNGFTRWIDGWIYACHGFRNTSNVKGGDGHSFQMNSGNTYRFREDGSRIEQFTWGQVNPFGLTFDSLGNAYTADCHSMPLTLLLRGAYYSSFGKPHDGLGFGPNMIDHGHGSTGICGPAFYAAAHFPAAYRDNLFLCNPVTGQVHRDRLKDAGSTRLVETQPDFITCDDPWFRPVDLQVGPDGALYIADFYNAIIGHYEVPLTDPRRDRQRGRVWRVVYRGEKQQLEAPVAPNLTQLTLPQLLVKLGDANLVVRTMATNEIVDRFSIPAVPAVRALLASESSPSQRAHGLWILFRLKQLDVTTQNKLSRDESRLVRTHLVKSLAERAAWQPEHFAIVRRLLADRDAFVRRAAADALGRQPQIENVQLLLSLLAGVSEADTHLRHAAKIALRNQLRDDTVIAQLDDLQLNAVDRHQLAAVTIAVPTASAANWLAKQLEELAVSDSEYESYVKHVARHGSAASLESLATTIRKRFATNLMSQHQQLVAVQSGLEQRGVRGNRTIRDWASQLARTLFTAEEGAAISWTHSPLAGTQRQNGVWTVQQRRCDDGKQAAFFCTLPSGEKATGVLRSEAFVLPDVLSFYVAGHGGLPKQPRHTKNVVRLRNAKTGTVLAETFPPRNDTARQVQWTLPEHAGEKVYFELIDGDDNARGYAWLAVGRFSLAGLNAEEFASFQAAAKLVERFQLNELQPELGKLLADENLQTSQRVAAAEALLALKSDARLSSLIPMLGIPTTADSLRAAVFEGVRRRDDKQIADVLAVAMASVSAAEQTALANTLVGDAKGGEALLGLVAAGKASARLLTLPTVRQKLNALKLRDADVRIAELTSRLPSPNVTIAKLIAARRESFSTTTASAVRGLEVFKQNCAACHRIGKEGALIAPQLDGIGLRPVDRLLEDVLDPNRNVDAAFRSTTIVLTSGKVRTGLFRREQGATLVFADDKGKEFTIGKAEIEETSKSPLSPMPGNFGEKLKAAQFHDLLAYLLQQRTKPVE